MDYIAYNHEISDQIAAFIEQEKAMTLSVRERVDALKEIQAMIMLGSFEPGVVEAVGRGSDLAVGDHVV